MEDEREFLADLIGIARQNMAQRAFKAEREDRFDEAERIYREWIDYLPDDPAPKYGLSLLLLSQGHINEGLRLYEARLELPGTGIIKPVYSPR